MNHVSLSFANDKDPALLVFSQKVHTAFVANAAALTGCPVSAATLDTANNDFSAKLAAMDQGGTNATAAKSASREALLALLRQMAAWLEGKAMGNAELITLAGFKVVAHVHTPSVPLDRPAIKAILNQMTTQLKFQVGAVAHAHSYEVQFRIGTGAWQGAGAFANTRSIVVINLTPGTLYEFRVRAIGGSTGTSDWSDPVSHMAT